MKFFALLAPFLFLAAGTAGWTQEPSPPKEAPPDPPLMSSAPADCQWTITYTPKTPEKEPATADDIRNRKMRQRYSPMVLAKHVIKSAGQVAIYTTYEANMKSEAWVVNGYLFELPLREGEGIRGDARGQGDFPEIDWVSAANFRGTVDLKGNKAHLYAPDDADAHPAPSPSSGPHPTPLAVAPLKPAQLRAYIDAKTRLPVMVDTGATVMTYQYTGPAATPPVPDERIKKIMRDSPRKR